MCPRCGTVVELKIPNTSLVVGTDGESFLVGREFFTDLEEYDTTVYVPENTHNEPFVTQKCRKGFNILVKHNALPQNKLSTNSDWSIEI